MFPQIFFGLLLVAAILYIITWIGTKRADVGKEFQLFQARYFLIYGLAVVADWLQGPHVYALYASYGLAKSQINFLFVCGYTSSLFLGTVIGSVADKLGRKKFCILYAVLYCGTCAAANFNNFWILLAGRICGGIATSLLFSCFESWVCAEHLHKKYSPDLLGVLFSNAALLNSIIAMLCGIAADHAADHLGYTGPFNIAIVFLVAMMILTAFVWTENYGSHSGSFAKSFKIAAAHIRKSPIIICLGLIQGLFEGTMYIFVLEWTPALVQAYGTSKMPYGYIFSGYMVSMSLGSLVFKVLSKYCRVEAFMRYILAIAALCMLTPIILPNNVYAVFAAFLIYEGCIGLFWPSMGQMRGTYVPEEARTTIINLFRIGLNIIVIFILLNHFPMQTTFYFCVGLLVLATIAQIVLCWKTTGKTEEVEIPEAVVLNPVEEKN